MSLYRVVVLIVIFFLAASVSLSFGRSVEVNVSPESFYIGELQLQDRSTVTLKLTFSDTIPVSLAIYWRKGEIPTHTQYDITRTVNSGSRYTL